MLTRGTKRGRAMLVGACVLAATLVGGGRAQANPASFSDPNDIGGKLDVTSVNVDNSPSVITYQVTMDAFAPADVSRVTFLFDFNTDGVADNCLLVGQSSGPTGLEGTMYSGCTESDLIGTATASVVSGNILRVDLPIHTLRQGGMSNASAYAFRVETRDIVNPSATAPDDIAPDSGFGAHVLGSLVCGGTITKSVKLTEDITGCQGDGLIVGKSGKKRNGKIKFLKVNLAGHTISSAYTGSSTTTGSGVRVGAFKWVQITNGTVSGFSKGIDLSGSTASQAKGAASAPLTISGNTTGVSLTDGKLNTVAGVTVQNNRGAGVSVSGAKHKLLKNKIQANGTDGIQNPSGSGVLISGNTSSGNGTASGALNGDGIDVDGTTAKITKNIANDNDGDGINAEGSARGSRNTATGNAGAQCTPDTLC